MLKHLLVFKLKDSALGKTRAQNAVELKKRIEALKSVISQVINIEAGVNAVNTPRSYDLALYSEFRDEADLEIYRVHPAHVKLVEFIEQVCENRISVDYKV
jgi:hypothetical protein